MAFRFRGAVARLRASTRVGVARAERTASIAFILGAGAAGFLIVDAETRYRAYHEATHAAQIAHVDGAAGIEHGLRQLAKSAWLAADTVARTRAGADRALGWPLEQLAATAALSSITVYWADGAVATVVGAAPQGGESARTVTAPRLFAARQADGAVARWTLFAARPVETLDGRRGVVVVGAAPGALLASAATTGAPALALRSDSFDLAVERPDGASDPDPAAMLDMALATGAFAAPAPAELNAAFAAASSFEIGTQRIAVATAHPTPWTPTARTERLVLSAAGALGAASLALILVAAAIWRPRRIVQSLLSSIELSGEAGVVFIEGVERADDLGALARRIQRLAQEHARMRAALDASRSMMMIANRAGLVFYVNPQLKLLFAEHAERFAEEFPGVPFPDVEGSLLSVFHDKLGMAEDAATEKAGRIVAGGRKLDIHVTPIRDRLGVQIGAFAQWDDVTGELEIESEIDGMVDMISMGELDMRMAISSDRGVYAKVGDGVNSLMEILSESVAKLNAFLGSMAQGDLSQTMPDDMMGSFGELASSANSTVRRVAGVVAEIRDAAQTLTAEVERLRDDMQQLSARSEEATRALADTTDAAQTLSGSIVQNAERLLAADALAKRTSEAAGRGAAVARDSTAAMKAIERSSAKVTEIADVIDEIAFQTNMLALNAAVEAARAGEAGRGFSVVATEVRALSQRVATSAADIKQLLDRSNAEVRRGVDLAREAGVALAEIETGLSQSVTLIAGIAEGGRAQEQGVATMTTALDSLSEITHRNAEMAQGAAEAIQQMSALADRLDAGVSFFHGEPEGMDRVGADGGMTADDLPPWPEDDAASADFDPSDWTDATEGSAGDLPPWRETELDRSLAAFDADAEMEAMIREAEKAAR